MRLKDAIHSGNPEHPSSPQINEPADHASRAQSAAPRRDCSLRHPEAYGEFGIRYDVAASHVHGRVTVPVGRREVSE
jgi:hypothetical protein